MNTVDFELIRSLDSAGMFQTLKDFPKQIEDAVAIARKHTVFHRAKHKHKLFILGMGGSAIGGDLLRSYNEALSLNSIETIGIVRNYMLPKNLNSRSCVIASSYSGNTEEVLASVKLALEVTDDIVCLTTGGKLQEFAEKHHLDVVNLPTGYQPREAIAFSFFVMLGLLRHNGFFPDRDCRTIDDSTQEILGLIGEKSVEYSDLDGNLALDIAKWLYGSLPVVYSSSQYMDSVNLRWRAQINENSKLPAFGSFLPEMNHNEVNAWMKGAEINNLFKIIFLKDKTYHHRTLVRFEALESLLKDAGLEVMSLEGSGKYLLTRMFELLYLGDWVSYYLALLLDKNPTEIPNINFIKDFLSKK